MINMRRRKNEPTFDAQLKSNQVVQLSVIFTGKGDKNTLVTFIL